MTICKGKNCKAIDGVGHSLECIDEHDKQYEDGIKKITVIKYEGYNSSLHTVIYEDKL